MIASSLRMPDIGVKHLTEAVAAAFEQSAPCRQLIAGQLEKGLHAVTLDYPQRLRTVLKARGACLHHLAAGSSAMKTAIAVEAQ